MKLRTRGARTPHARLTSQLAESLVPIKAHRRGWMLRRALALADVVGLTTAFLIAEWMVAVRQGSGTFSQ